MTRPIVIHLYDDATPGGVMRVLDHIRNDPTMARDAEHRFRPVRRGVWSFGRIEADIIVSHLAVNWRGLPGLIALRALHPGQALVHVEHSYTQAFVAGNVPNRARFETLLRTAYALFDRVVAVSQAQGAWLRDRRLVSDAALAVIRSAVDLGRFHALPPPRRTPKVLGAIGRLDRQKGFDILINALRSDPDLPLQLFVFGEGPERARLEALAAGDARIAFRGHVSDPVAAMAAVDAVAMPSRWEAFGLVASEARAAGRPVLAAPVDGLRDHIFDGARSVPSLSEADWQAGLRELGKVAGKQDTTSRTSAGTTTFQTEWRKLIVDMMHTQGGDCSTSPIKLQRAPVPSVAAVGVFGRKA